MRSNGFGSMEQTIIIHVPEEQAPELVSLLDCAPMRQEGGLGRSYFSWSRWTTRTGDDEDVVFDLFMTLGAPSKEFDWEVDWGLSEY